MGFEESSKLRIHTALVIYLRHSDFVTFMFSSFIKQRMMLRFVEFEVLRMAARGWFVPLFAKLSRKGKGASRGWNRFK